MDCGRGFGAGQLRLVVCDGAGLNNLSLKGLSWLDEDIFNDGRRDEDRVCWHAVFIHGCGESAEFDEHVGWDSIVPCYVSGL